MKEDFESESLQTKDDQEAESFRRWQKNIGITEDELSSKDLENTNPNSLPKQNISNYSYSDTCGDNGPFTFQTSQHFQFKEPESLREAKMLLKLEQQKIEDSGPLLKPDPSPIELTYLSDSEPQFLTQEKVEIFEEKEQ